MFTVYAVYGGKVFAVVYTEYIFPHVLQAYGMAPLISFGYQQKTGAHSMIACLLFSRPFGHILSRAEPEMHAFGT